MTLLVWTGARIAAGGGLLGPAARAVMGGLPVGAGWAARSFSLTAAIETSFVVAAAINSSNRSFFTMSSVAASPRNLSITSVRKYFARYQFPEFS